MSPEELKGLERLAKEATPGPWIDHSYRSDQARVYTVCLLSSVRVARVHEGNPRRAAANAAFIAAANPQSVLALISLAREAEGLRADYLAERQSRMEHGAREAAILAAIGTVEFMDPADGGDVSLAEQVRRLNAARQAAEAEVERLRRAVMAAQSFIADSGQAEDEPAASIYRQLTQVLQPKESQGKGVDAAAFIASHLFGEPQPKEPSGD